jgi:Phosphotransferase enzyme family
MGGRHYRKLGHSEGLYGTQHPTGSAQGSRRKDAPCSIACSPSSPSAPSADRCRDWMMRSRACANAPTALERAGRDRHMDYHPRNVIVRGMRVTGVIDWLSADRGGHLDAATTSAILATAAMDHPRWMRDNRADNSLRALFAVLYFPAYHALAPMDLDRFRYRQAVTALFRLSTFGMMRTRGSVPSRSAFAPRRSPTSCPPPCACSRATHRASSPSPYRSPHKIEKPPVHLHAPAAFTTEAAIYVRRSRLRAALLL